MLGSVLFLVSTLLLVRGLPQLAPARRCALASLLALVVPMVALCLAARLKLRIDAAIVLASHLLLWWFALVRIRSRRQDGPAGELLAPLGLALAVAGVSALLGRNPSHDALIDPWAHLAWARNLPDALFLYPPGFPAVVRSLTLDHPLIGAFRSAPVVLHVTLACQFLALGATGGRIAPAALFALLYLIIPVSQGKFEPPRPELLAAILIVASWWILLASGLSRGARRGALGLCTAALLVAHVSVLELAHLAALGLAVILGAGERAARDRGMLLASIAAGGGLSLLISPWPWKVMFTPQEIPLVAHQPGTVDSLSPRSLALLWGLDLTAWMVVTVAWIPAAWSRFGFSTRRVLAALGLAAALLLAPLLLIRLDVHLPLQLFTHRLALGAALPLAAAVALVLSHRSTWPGVDRALTAGLVLLTLAYKTWRPGVPASQLLLALLVAVLGLAAARATTRTPWVVAGLAGLALAAWGIRLWIWTPHEPPVVRWLREEAEPRVPVVTNWPVTNALDALVSRPVMDGLAGRDANVGLHRAHEVTTLRGEILWCGDGGTAAAALATHLQTQELRVAYVVVDPRFETTWSDYARERAHMIRIGRLGRYPFFQEPPCPEPAPVRLGRMREALRADVRFAPVFGDVSDLQVFRFQAPP